jgi:copper oxidase (laccase) domain-containing protein
VEHRVIERFGEQSEYLLAKVGEKVFFYLWKANELLLRDAGVSEIECAEICTACNTQDWYSHRHERGKTGRFAAVAFLK